MKTHREVRAFALMIVLLTQGGQAYADPEVALDYSQNTDGTDVLSTTAPRSSGVGEPRDPAFVEEAVQNVLEEAAGASDAAPPSPTEATVEETAAQAAAFDSEPPAGAVHTRPAHEAVPVKGGSVRLKRFASKPVAEGGAAFMSATGEGTADDWRSVSFASGSFVPETGLDPAMAAEASRLRDEGRDFVYGFLLLDEYLREQTQRKLQALGVTILGPHGNLYKAKFPSTVDALKAVADLPYVEWVGYSMGEQKLDRALQPSLRSQAATATPETLPVIINLFEADRDGIFKRQLEASGATVGKYDPDLRAYHAVASWAVIDAIVQLDFVLFVEPIREMHPAHDQSMSTMGADYIRLGGFGLRFDGASIPFGIMDSGFMLGDAAPVMHLDLSKFGCGQNFTTDAAGVWNDENGHGTHVLATASGTGTADNRHRGVATGVGDSIRIRAAKVFDKNGNGSSIWTENAMDFLSNESECGSPRPQVINFSGGGFGTALTGTDSESRKLDEKTWTSQQLYVVAAGNEGPGQTVRLPGVAKNALTVGNVRDFGFQTVGDISGTSSQGPTGDGRMKPNLVAPGNLVTSARAGTTNQYRNDSGTSMAAPHVAGLATTLMQHYPEFQSRPYLLRAHLMGSAILHDDVTTPSDNFSGGRNDYGLGRVSSYVAHWARPNPNGWSTHWTWGTVDDTTWRQSDIEVPSGTQRLVVAMTWDEPAASAGASRAVIYDLDLWVDADADCTPDPKGQCGEWTSQSGVDNVEYLIINNPPAGTYRLKAIPWNAPSSGLPAGIAATIIQGDPQPAMSLTATASETNPAVGEAFTVTTTVTNPSYIASGVHIAQTGVSSGLTLERLQTIRQDDVSMDFGTSSELTLGDIHESDSRSAVWSFRPTTEGTKTISFRAWSENGGTRTFDVQVAVEDNPTVTVTATDPTATEAGTTTGTFTVSRTGSIAADLTVFYDVTGTATAGSDYTALLGSVTIPSGSTAADIIVTPINDTAIEVDETVIVVVAPDGAYDIGTPGSDTVTIASDDISTTRDLVETTVTNPPATAKRGGSFSVTDTAKNQGTATAGASTTRYYLSLDKLKSSGDKLLTGSRAVPSLAPGAQSAGTVTVTIPSTTALGSYHRLACADDAKVVAESNESNNCKASATKVQVTAPDLVETTVTNPPATAKRGSSFSVTDTAKNQGTATAGASTTRYYLSLDKLKSSGDKLLTGSRAVPSLAPGAQSAGTVTVTIPSTTALGSYHRLACADDAKVVAESQEGNNCKASKTKVQVNP